MANPMLSGSVLIGPERKAVGDHVLGFLPVADSGRGQSPSAGSGAGPQLACQQGRRRCLGWDGLGVVGVAGGCIGLSGMQASTSNPAVYGGGGGPNGGGGGQNGVAVPLKGSPVMSFHCCFCLSSSTARIFSVVARPICSGGFRGPPGPGPPGPGPPGPGPPGPGGPRQPSGGLGKNSISMSRMRSFCSGVSLRVATTSGSWNANAP